MFRHNEFLQFLTLLMIIQIPSLYACRFNVRETGFVDFADEHYLLVGYINNQTPLSIVKTLQTIPNEILLDSNVGFQMINVDESKDNAAIIDLLSIGIEFNSYPMLLLISPEGEFFPIKICNLHTHFSDSLKSVLKKIIYSPIRNKIREYCVASYGMILMIEGSDKTKNNIAKIEAKKAIKKVQKKMVFMPKEIKEPPALVVLKYTNRLNDRILLRILGIEAGQMNVPYAAVFYGKGRWLGPLFKEKDITQANLSEILLVIGADCECGLDKNWLRGTMLPMIWNKKAIKNIAQNIGFDPQNPLTKIEINQIMRIGVYSNKQNKTRLFQQATGDVLTSSEKGINLSINKEAAKSIDAVADDSIYSQKRSPIVTSLVVTTIMLVLIFFAGLGLFYLRRKDNI